MWLNCQCFGSLQRLVDCLDLPSASPQCGFCIKQAQPPTGNINVYSRSKRELRMSIYIGTSDVLLLYSLVGSLNKIPISLAGLVLFKVPLSLPNLFSILFGKQLWRPWIPVWFFWCSTLNLLTFVYPRFIRRSILCQGQNVLIWTYTYCWTQGTDSCSDLRNWLHITVYRPKKWILVFSFGFVVLVRNFLSWWRRQRFYFLQT